MLVPGPVSDALDLVLGRACISCERPGPALCPRCLSGLRGRATSLAPSARLPAGLPPVTAALPYPGAGSRLILDYKEHGNRALAPMLGVLLADAIAAHPALRGQQHCTIVPVPGHRRSRRGFDALGDVCAIASRALSTGRRRAAVRGLLRSTHTTPALKGLTRDEREAAVSGAFRVRRSPMSVDRGPVLVVDDVLTSGSTAAEAVRALREARIDVHGIAVIADATTRER